jgi:hypothetical protein
LPWGCSANSMRAMLGLHPDMGCAIDRTHTTPLLTQSPVELDNRSGANH